MINKNCSTTFTKRILLGFTVLEFNKEEANNELALMFVGEEPFTLAILLTTW
jgi:hypothetical protein